MLNWFEHQKMGKPISVLVLFLLCPLLIETLAAVRYRARVAYDGAGFRGFQLQGTATRTVQSELERVIRTRCDQPHVRVVAAGRTDAGVHARGQAIHFDLETDYSKDELKKLEISFNKMLTPDVRIWNIQRAPAPAIKTLEDGKTGLYDWNTMYDSTRKLYSYRLSFASVLNPLIRHNRWRPDNAKGVDKDHLQRLCRYYEGTHDFRSFAGSLDRLERILGKELDTIRTVYAVDLVDEGDDNYRLDFMLKGALYKQVRNMVGTALDVCRGRISEEQFLHLLGYHDCQSVLTRDDNPAKPAPPEGLTLEFVYFDNDPDF